MKLDDAASTGVTVSRTVDRPAVNKAIVAAHAYKLLDAELNTRPAVTYLARIRNRPASAEERKHLDDVHAAHHGAASAAGPAPVKETH